MTATTTVSAPRYRDDATALASAIASSQLTAPAAMEAALAAAERFSGLGAITRLMPELGRRDAARADLSGPFGGVPTLAKDLGGPFAGVPVHAGSRTLIESADGTPDSVLAQRFRAAGFCLFGSTTVPEFGLSLSSEPAGGPVCRNPLDTTRSAGGSSGGAAAAVAAGIVAIAHATDAGGSIRVPAACCGLVGLKPGRGAIPGGPGFGNHLGGIASELAVCRSVRDATTIFDCIAGKAEGPFPDGAQMPVPQGKLRIGLLTDCGPDYPISEERQVALEDAARVFKAQGHAIVPLRWGQFEGLVADSARVFDHIVSVNLAELFDSFGLDESRAEAMTRAVVARGRALGGTELWQTLNRAVTVSHAMWRLFESVDVMLVPMLASAPPLLGSFPTDHGDVAVHFERMTALAPLAGLGNVSGVAAMTLPFGEDGLGLPLPVQMLAPMGGEKLLLALASRLEAEQRWSHRFPVAGLAA